MPQIGAGWVASVACHKLVQLFCHPQYSARVVCQLAKGTDRKEVPGPRAMAVAADAAAGAVPGSTSSAQAPGAHPQIRAPLQYPLSDVM